MKMDDPQVKEQVQQFYNRVGWQVVGEGLYQNARYEDLRPVAQEYIHRCHLRVKRFLKPEGQYLLDAGCGPIQYPEYLTYSQGYRRRVCLDISIVALQEARKRIGDHGLFVVADVANLPFKPEAFDGFVSLHTLHHLPVGEQKKAYFELHRVLKTGERGVVVNGWTDSALMRRSLWLVKLMERLGRGRQPKETSNAAPAQKPKAPTGTYVQKFEPAWLQRELGGRIAYRVLVWRSVSVRWLRAVIHERLLGRVWLRLLYALEERFPRFLGEKGQYPLIVIEKNNDDR